MSWDSYITTLTQHNMIAEAAIWGKSANAVAEWASSAGLKGITAAEVTKLTGDANSMRQNGPLIGGVKCMLLRDNSSDPLLYSLDLKTAKDDQGRSFCVCVGVSLTALVIAKGADGAHGGTVAAEVFKIVEYLRKLNY